MPLAHFPGNNFICHDCSKNFPTPIGHSPYFHTNGKLIVVCDGCLKIRQRKQKLIRLNAI